MIANDAVGIWALCDRCGVEQDAMALGRDARVELPRALENLDALGWRIVRAGYDFRTLCPTCLEDETLDQLETQYPQRNAPKPVYRGRRRIGYARSWSEVAALIGDKRPQAGACLSRENVEGPDGFFLRDKK